LGGIIDEAVRTPQNRRKIDLAMGAFYLHSRYGLCTPKARRQPHVSGLASGTQPMRCTNVQLSKGVPCLTER